MKCALNTSQQIIKKKARTFAQEHLLLSASQRESQKEITPSLLRQMSKEGFFSINLPQKLGGLQAGVIAYACAIREIAYADASVALSMAVTSMVGEIVARFGTQEQIQTDLPAITAGKSLGGAFALSESGAGSDPAAMKTRAEKTQNGCWCLNGTKLWITQGDQASVLIVWAKTDPDLGGKGMTAFLMPQNSLGLSAQNPEDKTGLKASHTVGLTLDNVELKPNALLGHIGQGFPIALAALDGGRIGIGAQACGIGFRALDILKNHTQKQKGQATAYKNALADGTTHLCAAWNLIMDAAHKKENHQPFTHQASMAKMMASEVANRILQQVYCLGVSSQEQDNTDLERMLRDVRATKIYEGTSEIQRLVIARSVLPN